MCKIENPATPLRRAGNCIDYHNYLNLFKILTFNHICDETRLNVREKRREIMSRDYENSTIL